jgi:hypothetical protein
MPWLASHKSTREVPDLNIADVGDRMLMIGIQHFWPDNE